VIGCNSVSLLALVDTLYRSLTQLLGSSIVVSSIWGRLQQEYSTLILFLSSRFFVGFLLVGVRILATTVLYIVNDNDNNQPNFTVLSIVQYVLFVDGQPSENGSCSSGRMHVVGTAVVLCCRSWWVSIFCCYVSLSKSPLGPVFFFFCDRMKGVAVPLLCRITFHDVIMHCTACCTRLMHFYRDHMCDKAAQASIHTRKMKATKFQSVRIHPIVVTAPRSNCCLFKREYGIASSLLCNSVDKKAPFA
jgi:hypothetical protein